MGPDEGFEVPGHPGAGRGAGVDTPNPPRGARGLAHLGAGHGGEQVPPVIGDDRRGALPQRGALGERGVDVWLGVLGGAGWG